ncbi:MAG: penicillin-binding protein 2 [Candidatus Marinimicrobia bacterium]|nr:penicillin-binding protein 2 [Candidatus Neomarinimicrobiota bacterium]
MLKAENSVTIRQYWVAIGITFSLIAILLGRYFFLQIVNNHKYKTKADNNRIRTVIIPAPRGLILDRNGQIIVDNYPTYVLTAVPGEMKDRPKQIGLLSTLVNIDSSLLTNNYKKYRRGQFVPARLAKDLSFDQISKLEENKRILPGISYSQFPERFYPSQSKISHILGYVKVVDQTIRSKLENSNDYKLGDLLGWSGIEKQYELDLKGKSGVNYLEVDAHGREVGHVLNLKKINPEPGQNIITSFDIGLQSRIEELLLGHKGAVIVSNSNTGEIISAISAPAYEPGLFSGVISPKDWNKVINDSNNPLLNRMVQGLYQPGSIIKMVSAFALMDNPGFDPDAQLNCSGFYQFGDRLFGCWLETGHGDMDLKDAITQSCDVYFYKTVQHLEVDHLAKWFSDFGFGIKTNLDLPVELTGVVPTKSYFNKRYGKYGWSKGALLNLGIGQGELLVTPIQVAKYINLLATNGKTPFLHFNITSEKHLDNYIINIDPELWDYISSSMYNVINAEEGTGRKARINNEDVHIYGKTGSAENPHGKTHAWFVGYAKRYNEIFSVTILLENSGSGGAIAAPIAHHIFNYIFNEPNHALIGYAN